MTRQEVAEFNTLFNNACERLNGLMVLSGYRQKDADFFEKIRIKKSIKEFEKCLSLVPGHWQSMLFLGKAYQKMGDHHAALSFLEKAMAIEPSNYSISQEASLEALQLDDINKAIKYSGEAVRINPNNTVLMGNHAMNLLIANKDDEAMKMIEDAIRLDPNDKINLNVQKLIQGVMTGQQPRPTCKTALGIK